MKHTTSRMIAGVAAVAAATLVAVPAAQASGLISAPQLASVSDEVEVTTANLQEVLAESSKRPVFMDFSTSWCGYCKYLTPLMKKYNKSDAGKWVLADVDGDKMKDLVKEYKVPGYPTVVPLKDGKELAGNRMDGWLGNEAKTREWIVNTAKAWGVTLPDAPAPAPTSSAPAPTTSAPGTRPPMPTMPPVTRPTNTSTATATRPPMPGKPTVTKTVTQTITATATKTVTAPAPGPSTVTATVTQTVPGPTVTVTVTPTTGAPSAPAGSEPGDIIKDGVFKGAYDVTSANHDKFMELSKKKLVIIDFSKEGCMPCEAMAPVLRDKNAADKKDWAWGILDGTIHQDLWQKYGLPWFPTMLAFKDGKEVARHTGYDGDAAEVKHWIDTLRAGQIPPSSETAMNITSQESFDRAVKLSMGKTIAIRFATDTEDDMYQLLNNKATADKGKWVLASVDGLSRYGQELAKKLNTDLSGMDAKKSIIVVLYEGRTWQTLVPNQVGLLDQAGVDAFIKKMTQTYYDPKTPADGQSIAVPARMLTSQYKGLMCPVRA